MIIYFIDDITNKSRSHSLQNNDFLPAFNFIYTPKENTNLRFSYTKTLARRPLGNFRLF